MSVETPVRDIDERRWFRPVGEGAGAEALARAHPLPARRDGNLATTLRPAGGAASGVAAGVRALPGLISVAAVLERERGTPFLLLPVLLAIGALVYFRLADEPGWLPLLAALAICGACAALTTPGRWSSYAALAALLFFVGIAVAKVETWRAGTRVIGGEISTRVTGSIVAIDQLDRARTRLTIDVQSTARPTLRYAPGRIRVTMRGAAAGTLSAGDTVEVLVRLRPPPGPVQPGSYDFSFESYFDGIGASGYVLSPPVRLAGGSWTWGAWIENVRNTIADRIRSRIGGAEGEIAAALMVGVRAGIPTEASEALRRTGLYHVISISGLHMALVAGTVIGAIRALFALFPVFSARHPIRKYSAIAGIVAISAYLVISGGEVAAQRSYLMLGVMLGAMLFDRAALTMRNLAISAAIVLVVSPHEVVGPSFQMSFAATAALVGAYALWSERRRRRGRRQVNPLLPAVATKLLAAVVGIVATSLIAGLATAAFGAWHFQRVSPLSVFANLAAMPIVSAIVVPAALLASVAMPFGLDGPFLFVMGKGLSVMLLVAEWFSQRSPVDAVGLVSGWGVALLTIALVIVTVATTRLRWAALPFAVAGLALLPMVRAPDVLVAEDGRLVGFRAEDGAFAVNRSRPNAFTLDSWRRAMGAATLVKPSDGGQPSQSDATGGFKCEADTCRATTPGGRQIVYTADAHEAYRACGSAALIVFDDATLPIRCADPAVVVVTKQDLARFGSAAVYLYEDGPQVIYAASASARPWHDHRRFSREARGMPPYQPKKKSPDNRGKINNPEDTNPDKTIEPSTETGALIGSD